MENIVTSRNFIWLFLTVIACSASSDQATPVVSFSGAEEVGIVENDLINEASGLVHSIANNQMLWVHNDSGNDAELYLIDTAGRGLKAFTLGGITNRDWEDIAIGPGPEDDVNYLYVAETGDNNAIFDLKYIYRFKEPSLNGPDTITGIETIKFRYEDGKRDAECLLVDPLTKDIYVISKREENVGIYIAPYPQSTTDTLQLNKVGSLPYNNIVAGDISTDGKEIILKTYDEVFYWLREPSLSIHQTLTSNPVPVKYNREPQGEAMGWDMAQRGFYTLSEEKGGIACKLYYYRKK